MRSVEFLPKAMAQFTEWIAEDPKMARRIVRLINESVKTPFEGIAKPEPLKGNLRGKWSKRINDEHRLVYAVTDDVLTVFSCKFHYEE